MDKIEIVSYENISSIIDKKNNIYFSSDYYKSLKLMSDFEIENILKIIHYNKGWYIFWQA